MTDTEAIVGFSKSKIAPPTTLMPISASAIASQDITATLVTAKTLLLLISGHQFDKTVTPTHFEPTQSSASKSQHIVKLPFRAPSNAKAFPGDAEVQLDLLLANQHTIMAN